MYGHNYEVTFGMKLFDDCSGIDDFRVKLKETFKDSQPGIAQIVPVNNTDFWEEINYAFTYRGEYNAGLKLNEKDEAELANTQNIYRNFINGFIDNHTKIYSYLDPQGIPGDPIYWYFRFLIFVGGDSCLFIYGSSSD
jgi:hypothetical protein